MEYIIERSNEDGSYTTVGEYSSFDEALAALKVIKSPLRHGIWCDSWVNTEMGYLYGLDKLKLDNTLKL